MARAPEAAGARHPRRLDVASLELHAQSLARGLRATRPALLSVQLIRGDRMRALLGRDDTLGVLDAVLDRIESALRPADRYAVVTIDEVWVVLSDAPAEAIARLAATALRDRIDGHYDGRLDDGTPVRVTVRAAIGGAWTDRSPVDVGALMSGCARAHAEAASSEGRIAMRRATEDTSVARAQLSARLRDALEANALEVWYQPQVRLDDGGCPSLEALVRWQQPDGEPPVSAALLVSICEETGLVGELTRFALNTVLRHQMTWKAMGASPTVGINLSALMLADASFPALVAQLCDTWGMPASRLLFELTEGSIARNERETIEFMRRLRGIGCELSIDDFGTGYSSFAYLRHFPVNELKLDRAFVRELATQAADRRIVGVLVEVAHTFGLRALAEGVEDAETARLLAEIGCDMAQGWHFAKAMPGDAVPGWLSANDRARAARGTSPTA